MSKALVRASVALLALLALGPAVRAQGALPDVAAGGFVAFVERYPGYAPTATDGDLVTILNLNSAAGVGPGATITSPGLPPNPGGITANATTIHWKLGGLVGGNEQIRARQAPLEAPLVVNDDIAGSGRYQFLVPTVSSPASGSTPLFEVLTIGPGGAVTPTILPLSGAVEPGPYPPVVHVPTNRVFASYYTTPVGSGQDSIAVYAFDMGTPRCSPVCWASTRPRRARTRWRAARATCLSTSLRTGCSCPATTRSTPSSGATQALRPPTPLRSPRGAAWAATSSR